MAQKKKNVKQQQEELAQRVAVLEGSLPQILEQIAGLSGKMGNVEGQLETIAGYLAENAVAEEPVDDGRAEKKLRDDYRSALSSLEKSVKKRKKQVLKLFNQTKKYPTKEAFCQYLASTLVQELPGKQEEITAVCTGRMPTYADVMGLYKDSTIHGLLITTGAEPAVYGAFFDSCAADIKRDKDDSLTRLMSGGIDVLTSR